MPIKVTGLSHSYKAGTPFEKQVLFDIDLEIRPGEFVGIIGPSQAGKSTLAQYFNGLYVPAPGRGRVLVNGQDTADKKTDLVAIRHAVGYVFQNPECQLFKPTVGEDVAFGPVNQRCSKEETGQRVREAMETVGLNYHVFYQRDILALSGGQKRRAAIAGVLACRPQIMVLDDITAGLDPQGREDILAVIRRLHEEKGITTVLISSSMDDVARLAGRLLVMHQGRIVLDGATREIFAGVERLQELGLEPPQVIDIMRRLKQNGLEVPLGVLNLEEALGAVSEALEKTGVGKRWS